MIRQYTGRHLEESLPSVGDHLGQTNNMRGDAYRFYHIHRKENHYSTVPPHGAKVLVNAAAVQQKVKEVCVPGSNLCLCVLTSIPVGWDRVVQATKTFS